MLTTKPQPTSKTLPCGICGDTSGDCRQIVAGYLCHDEIGGLAPISNYKYVRPSRCGVWGLWVPESNSFTEADRQQWIENKRRAEHQHRAESMPVIVRDRHYRRILQELTLGEAEILDLDRRGFSIEEAFNHGYRSIEQWQPLEHEYPENLPGIGRRGRSLLNCEAGYICPARDQEGYITGLQYRLREKSGGGRYRWLSSAKIASVNLPNGEPPLSTFQADSSVMGFVEGIGPKPHFLSLRENISVIGASGRSWASSPHSLRDAIKAIAPSDCILHPDAGADTHTVTAYTKLYELLKPWGYLLQVAWWGQKTKADGDIDEISAEQRAAIEVVSFDDYLRLMKTEPEEASSS